MATSVTELLRRRHRALEARIVTLEIDPRVRRPRVARLAEELVAHATVEQLVVYPFAEQLLGLSGLAFEIEHALDSLVSVVSEADDDRLFGIALARLSAAFERHVDGDEIGILPMIEAIAAPEHLSRLGEMLEDFERTIAASRGGEVPAFWPESAGDVVARVGGTN